MCGAQKKVSDATSLQLVENEQRCDLDPLERSGIDYAVSGSDRSFQAGRGGTTGHSPPHNAQLAANPEASERASAGYRRQFPPGNQYLDFGSPGGGSGVPQRNCNPQLQDELLDLAEAHSVSYGDVQSP